MLVHRLQPWHNIDVAMVQCLVLSGMSIVRIQLQQLRIVMLCHMYRGKRDICFTRRGTIICTSSYHIMTISIQMSLFNATTFNKHDTTERFSLMFRLLRTAAITFVFYYFTRLCIVYIILQSGIIYNYQVKRLARSTFFK